MLNGGAQNMDEIKTLLMAVSRIEQKVDNLGNVREIAIETQQISKSAHNRIDDMKQEFRLSMEKLELDIEKDYNDKIKATNDNVDKINANLNKLVWLVISFVVLGVLGFVFNNVQ